MSVWTGEGAFALYGAFVGAGIGSGITWLEGNFRGRRERESRAKYLATRVVIAIDRFADDCSEALRAEPHPLDYDTDPDAFAPLPAEYREPEGIDWGAIDHDLAYLLLSIPARDYEARRRIRCLAEFTSDVRPLRDELFAKLAADVDSMADSLRREYGIPPRTENDS